MAAYEVLLLNTAIPQIQAAQSGDTYVVPRAIAFNAGVNVVNNDVTIYGVTVGRGAGAVASNTAVGASALAANTSGSENVSLGYQSLQANTTASNNTAVGYQAGYTNSTGAANTFVGRQAGYSATGTANTFVGQTAGYYSTGSYNTFVGTGSTNAAGDAVTTGSKNTIIGGYGGNQDNLDIRTASNYIVLSDGDGTPQFVHRKDFGVAINNRPQISSSYVDTQNKSVINLYEGTNGNIEIVSGYSTADFVVGTGGTSGNIAYSANGGSYLSVASGIMAIVGTTFTIGSNTYTVTSESSEGYVYCTPDASGEAATGTLVGLKYATEGFRVYDNRTAQFKSTVGVGGTAGSTSGAGITFPATQSASSDANTLDDYEEGTYVVTFTPETSGSITLDGSFNELSYIKIGSQVTIFGRVLISSVSSPVGAIRISMPFTPETGLVDQSDFYAMPMFTHDVDLSAGALSVFGESSGSNYWVIYQTIDNAAWLALPSGNLKGNGNEYFYITGSYRAA